LVLEKGTDNPLGMFQDKSLKDIELEVAKQAKEKK